MKKILFAIILFIFPLALSAQWYGDGKTPSTAYYGIINGSNTMQVWNTTNYPEIDYPGGVIYVGRSTSGQNDLEVEDGGALTIEQGITVKFCTTTSDLRITGTGVLNASGSSSSFVTFTKDTQESWGHITFESMGSAGSSKFEYCIFEFGRIIATGSSGDPHPVRYGCGGAIYTTFSDIEIINCTFRDNYSYFGAAIYAHGVAPLISKCTFIDNEAREAGGALSLYSGASPLIENCIFETNHANGISQASYSGGAIFFGPNAGSVYVVNCTFVNNTSDHSGDALYFYTSPNAKVVNSILWGTNDQIENGSSNIINCAIEANKPASSVNCIILNSSNYPAGPNFVETDGTDWSIKVISPCRDAGTTPSPTVPNDYDGNSRIGAYDIGAYEVQYNGWKTTGSNDVWSNGDNWEQGVPGASQNIVIPTGADYYPTSSSSQDYTIGDGYGMVLDPGAQATFGSLTTNGDLRLRSDASDISSLIINSTDVSAIVDIYLTGGGTSTTYKWHYISSPFSTSPSITPFTDITLNLAQFIQSLYADGTQAWVAYDGYIYSDPPTSGGQEFTVLSPGKGYNFYDNVDNEITISGQLSYSNLGVGLSFGDNGPSYSGFNLLGNPFSSGLDWDVIILDASYPANTSKGLYFTRNNVQCSYVADIGDPEDVTGIIPPMQGFFTKTENTGNPTLTLPADARTHNSIHARYKGKTTIPLVRLSITKDSLSDGTVVRFDEQAKPDLDNDFDALKMFLSDDKISIYSFDGETKYAINGQPFPETEVEIPIVVNLISEGDHKVSAIQLQGLDNYHVTLKDLVTGYDVDLKTTPELTFTDTAGTYTDRFILTISSTTGIEDIPDLPGLFNVFAANNQINIKTLSDAWNGKSGTIKIFDLTGRIVSEIHNTEFRKNSILQVPAPSVKGIYFVEISSGVMRYVGKVSTGY